MTAVIALALFVPAAVLQMLGYTGTCTQGSDGPFVAGTTWSAPLLFTLLALLIFSARRNLSNGGQAGQPLGAATALCLVPLASWSVFQNSRVAFDTLIAGTTPCGVEYTFSAAPFEMTHVFVGILYGVGPAMIAGAAAILLWTALPSRYRASHLSDGGINGSA